MSRVTTNQIMFALTTMNLDMTNPRNDGFSAWPIKQDLYKMKWAIDDMLEKAPTYAGEDAWLEEQKLDRAMRELGYHE